MGPGLSLYHHCPLLQPLPYIAPRLDAGLGLQGLARGLSKNPLKGPTFHPPCRGARINHLGLQASAKIEF